MKKLILLLLLFVGAMTQLSAQRVEGRLNLSDSTQVHQLFLTDGSVIVGRLMAMHAQTWEFKYSGKVEQIPTNTIDRLKVLDQGTTDGDNDVVMAPVNPTNNGNSEVMLTPTAIPLKKGQGYYETLGLYYHYVEYGFGKGFSMGLGGTFPLFVTRLRWGMPLGKFVNVGVCNTNYNTLGTFFGALSNRNGSVGLGTLGIVSGNVTIGKTNQFLNIGIGTSYVLTTIEGYLSKSSLPIISVGGVLPIGKRWALLSDNIILPIKSGNTNAQIVLPSLACRYFDNKIRVDIGLWSVILNNQNSSSSSKGTFFWPYPIPYLSFGFNFNDKDFDI